MAQKSKNTKQESTAETPHQETWEKESEQCCGEESCGSGYGPRISLQGVADALSEANRQLQDSIMAAVPPDVTQHMVNAQKELLAAGQRINVILNEKLDRYAQRAREVHERNRGQKPESPIHPPE